MIYVVIVTWNGMKWIAECLDSLRQSTVEVKTIVIDNGSKDSTPAFIRENYPEVLLLETGRNLGFGKANNVGIRYALDKGADYVYLLNQDAYVYPDMFEQLLKASETATESDNIGIYSPLHVYGNRKALDKQFKGYLKAVTGDMIEDVIFNSIHSVYNVDCVPAAGWLLPRRTLLKIGGFDPIFFHYGEDHNYAHRVKYHGMTTAVVPQAKMVHDRETFGNVTMAKKGAVMRNLETEVYLNINNSLPRQCYMVLNKYFFFILYAFREIAGGNGRVVWEQFTAIWKSFVRIPRYIRDRKANKQVGALWLDSPDIVELASKIK